MNDGRRSRCPVRPAQDSDIARALCQQSAPRGCEAARRTVPKNAASLASSRCPHAGMPPDYAPPGDRYATAWARRRASRVSSTVMNGVGMLRAFHQAQKLRHRRQVSRRPRIPDDALRRRPETAVDDAVRAPPRLVPRGLSPASSLPARPTLSSPGDAGLYRRTLAVSGE